MAEPAKIDLNRIKRGDTYIVDFFFADTDGTKDISAVTIAAQARRELDGAVWFDLNPVKIDAANGHFRIHLTAFQTRDITESPPGSFSGIYDIQFSWSGATEVYVSTIVSGSISISKDVTYQDVNVPVGGTSTAPAADQAIAVYFSLNPGTPNYSDVVTAEELTPAQYQIAASLGLANVNAINEAAESARLARLSQEEAKNSEIESKRSENLASIYAGSASSQAAKAKEEADKAASVVTGGTATFDPSPGKIPLSGADGKIARGWLPEMIDKVVTMTVNRDDTTTAPTVNYSQSLDPVIWYRAVGASRDDATDNPATNYVGEEYESNSL